MLWENVSLLAETCFVLRLYRKSSFRQESCNNYVTVTWVGTVIDICYFMLQTRITWLVQVLRNGLDKFQMKVIHVLPQSLKYAQLNSLSSPD